MALPRPKQTISYVLVGFITVGCLGRVKPDGPMSGGGGGAGNTPRTRRAPLPLATVGQDATRSPETSPFASPFNSPGTDPLDLRGLPGSGSPGNGESHSAQSPFPVSRGAGAPGGGADPGIGAPGHADAASAGVPPGRLVGPDLGLRGIDPLSSGPGRGQVTGRVNATPPSVRRDGSPDARTWAALVSEHNRLKAKPKLPPVIASAPLGQGQNAPPAAALAAVERCIKCHGSTSDRNLQMDPDPIKALAGLKLLIGKPTGVSWLKVTEMIRSTRFAALPPNEEKAFLAFLSDANANSAGGSNGEQSVDQLYAEINRRMLDGLQTPPERLPGSEKTLYRDLLKTVHTENPVLNAILRDPSLVIYDDGLKRKYQDGGSNDVIGDHHEDSAILQDWKRADGSPVFPQGRLFGPLGSGFGTSAESPNFKFIWRPRENGASVPDVMRVHSYRDSAGGASGQLMDTQYPVGTIFGEIVYEDGVVKDIRLREIAPGLRTQSTAYRKFTTAADMESAVSRLMIQRPDWSQDLGKLQAHLQSKNKLTPGPAIRDNYYTPVINVQGYQDVLPDITEDQQKALYKMSDFTSALQKEWKREGDKVSYAPKARRPSLIAARTINHHGVAVDSDSCMRCHEMTGTNFAFFDPNVYNTTTRSSNFHHYGVLYGSISNNILSHHSRPFDKPNDFGRGGMPTGNFATSQGRENLSDNRRDLNGSFKVNPNTTIVGNPRPGQEGYYQ